PRPAGGRGGGGGDVAFPDRGLPAGGGGVGAGPPGGGFSGGGGGGLCWGGVGWWGGGGLRGSCTGSWRGWGACARGVLCSVGGLALRSCRGRPARRRKPGGSSGSSPTC